MKDSREEILQKINKALKLKTTLPEFIPETEFLSQPAASQMELVSTFKSRLEELQGTCVVCESRQEAINWLQEAIRQNNWDDAICMSDELYTELKMFEFKQNLPELEEDRQVCLSDCEGLIAETGSIILSSAKSSGRVMPVYASVHIVLAGTNLLFKNLKDAISYLTTRYNSHYPSMLSIVSGPSRTGDIEKKLVLGVHGPKTVIVLLIIE